MTLYRGFRGEGGAAFVTADGRPLDPRHDIAHLCDEFDWGYAGAGPEQLALALLIDHWDDPSRALGQYRLFLRRVVKGLRGDDWTLKAHEIDEAFSEGVVDSPLTLDQLVAKLTGKG